MNFKVGDVVEPTSDKVEFDQWKYSTITSVEFNGDGVAIAARVENLYGHPGIFRLDEIVPTEVRYRVGDVVSAGDLYNGEWRECEVVGLNDDSAYVKVLDPLSIKTGATGLIAFDELKMVGRVGAKYRIGDTITSGAEHDHEWTNCKIVGFYDYPEVCYQVFNLDSASIGGLFEHCVTKVEEPLTSTIQPCTVGDRVWITIYDPPIEAVVLEYVESTPIFRGSPGVLVKEVVSGDCGLYELSDLDHVGDPACEQSEVAGSDEPSYGYENIQAILNDMKSVFLSKKFDDRVHGYIVEDQIYAIQAILDEHIKG